MSLCGESDYHQAAGLILAWFDLNNPLTFGDPRAILRGEHDPGIYTWAIGFYTPRTKILMALPEEIEGRQKYGTTCGLALRSVFGPIEETADDANFRSELREIQGEAKRLA